MILIKLVKNKNKTIKEAYGKYYARPVVTETIGIDELAEHMASHNTPFSKGAIKGLLTDMVSCVKELVLQNKAVNTLSLTNEFTTNKSIRTCPNTVEPYYLLNTFSWLITRDDLFLGFLLNRNVKVSTYVINQVIADDIDMATGDMIKATTGIESSFENNALTIQSTGAAISQAQGIYANKVVVKYKNK